MGNTPNIKNIYETDQSIPKEMRLGNNLPEDQLT